MPDYKNGKIYKIECQETNRIYIGSTCQPTVAGRLRGHIQLLQRYKKGGGNYTSSFSILETGNYKCLLVCNYPCDTKDELTTKEAEYIRQYKNDDIYECVNMCIPSRLCNEYLTDKKGYFRQYYEDNKDSMLQQQKQYRQTGKAKEFRNELHACDCGSKYTMQHKARHEKTKKHMKWEATQ